MNTLKNLFLNWRTTSAGFGLAIAGGVHLGFCIYRKSMSETDLVTTLMSICGGIGLIAAGDASVSATKSDMKEVSDAVQTGDTSKLEEPKQNNETH